MEILEEARQHDLIGAVPLTRDDLELILAEWQKRLNLSHWSLRIKWDEKPETEDAEADYSANDYYDDGFIRVREDWHKWDRREANVTIVHELVHIMQRDLDIAVNSLETSFKKDVWSMWLGRYDATREGFTERMAQVLVNLVGAV